VSGPVTGPPGRWRRLRRLAMMDAAPLREVPGFRWMFSGMLLQQTGRQLTVVAVPIQVFQLTGSTLAVGLLGLVQLVPLLAMSLVGGALADAVNRRVLLIAAQLGLAVTAFGLFANSLMPSPAIWPLYVLSGFNAAISAIDQPARNALLPGLVGRRLLPSALALYQMLSNIAKAAVPAIGGLVIASAGLGPTYAAEGILFLLSASLLRRVPDVPTEGGGRSFSLRSISEGLAYLKGHRLIQGALLIDLNAMVFGMPSALFPAFGTEVLGGDAFTIGLLYAGPGIGALAAALTSGWVASISRQGRAVGIAVVVWGGAIAVFGLTTSIIVAVAMLAVAGAADVVSAIYRNSIIQLSVPDVMRGRLSSIHLASAAGGPRLGDLEAGLVASLTTVRFSVVSGGVACILGALAIARWAPAFDRYRFDPTET
jgi:MFS family permease